jgi:hypothetical protein
MAGEITIIGADRVIAKLGRAKGMEKLRPPMVRAVARLHQEMAAYPPEPRGSSYVRTGTLGRKWVTRIDQSLSEISGRIGNNTEYAPIVQSYQFQTWFHKRTGWQTDRQVMIRNRDAIIQDFQQAIRNAIQ